MNSSNSNLLLVCGYVAVLAAALFGMTQARRWTMASLGNAEAAAEWQEWREETARQSRGSGPVKRRPAKATEPPMLILLRDHFAAAAVTTSLAVTIFYWFLAIVIRGSLRQKSTSRHSTTDGPDSAAHPATKERL